MVMMRMKKSKRTIGILFFTVIIVMIMTILSSIILVKTDDRKIGCGLPIPLKKRIEQETKDMNVEQIIDYSLELTASQLQFSRYNEIDKGKANCVGYARLCASICNQALAANGIKGQAKPVVGYIESIGINWCDALKTVVPDGSYKNFVKDHDFVELVTDSVTFYFDPSIYDVLGKKCLSTST